MSERLEFAIVDKIDLPKLEEAQAADKLELKWSRMSSKEMIGNTDLGAQKLEHTRATIQKLFSEVNKAATKLTVSKRLVDFPEKKVYKNHINGFRKTLHRPTVRAYRCYLKRAEKLTA